MTIDLHHLTDWVAYWVLGWSVINALLPPREVFKDSPKWAARYNIVLMLVAYYGSLNIRQLTVKMYDSVNQAPATPHATDLPPTGTPTPASTIPSGIPEDK